MEVKIINLDIDYFKLCEWWKQYNMAPIPKNSLSTNGIMIGNYCAGWYYKTDSDIGLIENFISNKETKKEDKEKALDLLFEILINMAKLNGNKFVFTASGNNNIITRGSNNFKFREINNYKVFVKELE